MTEIDALETLLARRHSCRAFRPDAVPEDIVERIVRAAGRVPSWCNAQPWHATVTRQAETDRLRDALYSRAAAGGDPPDIPFPAAYRGVYRDRRATCGWALYGALGIERGDRAARDRQMQENFRLFGAPHLALITTEADLGAYGALDCGAFVTAFALAAEALGVASIPQAALALHSAFLRDWFGLSASRQVVCGISFGYGDPNHPANGFRTDRAALDDILDWR